MAVPSLNNHKPRVARSPDKRSLKSREDRSELVLSTAANSPLWVGDVLRLLVRKPPGNFACRIETSPNPITPTSWVAVKGKGARRALSGYPSGGLWIRALLSDNENESDYSQPVFVMVP
jgi:hypothetical protein